MALSRSFWFALGSLPLIMVGALGPWAQVVHSRIDGPQDEIVLGLAFLAAVMLVAFAGLHRRSFALVPLLAGAAAAVMTGRDVRDTGDIAPHVNERLATVDWGLYLTVVGSIGLVLASMVMVVEEVRAPPRHVRRRIGTGLARVLVSPSALQRPRSGEPERRARRRKWMPEEVESRKAFVRAAREFTPYVALERAGALFFMATESPASWRRFSTRKLKDGRQLDRALRALELVGAELPGRVFVDAGANIGTSTVVALQEHGFESALAVEPDPENFRIMRANLAVNGLEEKVQVFNAALSNYVGQGELLLQGRGAETHRLARSGEQTAESLTVPVRTLDALMPAMELDPDSVGLLWIDVEGAEIEVLEGAHTLLERSVPIVVEFSPVRFRAAGQGRVESFVSVLSGSYTHFFDLGTAFPSRLGFEPLTATADLLTRRSDKTDLLVVRLDPDSAP